MVWSKIKEALSKNPIDLMRNYASPIADLFTVEITYALDENGNVVEILRKPTPLEDITPDLSEGR